MPVSFKIKYNKLPPAEMLALLWTLLLRCHRMVIGRFF